jgi:hypothetical protein
MPEQDGFQGELAAALGKRASSLATDVLPMIKESFKLYHSLFRNLYNLLYRKSLIQEDPYQYDHKLSELVLPSRGPIADSERQEVLSRRLSELLSQLEFLNGAYQFSLEFLGLERLKLLGGLVHFIDWSNLMTASPDANTAVLAETLGRIKLGADKVSAGIVSDTCAQLAALAPRVLAGLREVTAWQREAYKLELRRCLQRLGPELARILKAGPAEALPRVQRACRQLEPERPFYTELASEALAEDYSDDGPRLRAEALARLTVAERVAAPPAPPVDYRVLLLEAVRLMLPLHLHLGEALARLEANREQQDGRRRGWRRRLRALFGLRRDPSAVLEIRQFDNTTGVARPTRVNFPQFADRVRRKKTLLEALASSTSSASARLRAASEPGIYEFLNKNLAELHGMYRIMEGLDAYFKAGKKEEVKGIKIDLAAIKNALVRANKQRYEYAARKEEEKQRQQMGLA